jgi:hypothetical protein
LPGDVRCTAAPQDTSCWLEIQQMHWRHGLGKGVRLVPAARAADKIQTGRADGGAGDRTSERCRAKAGTRQGSSYGASVVVVFALLAALANAVNEATQHIASTAAPRRSSGWRLVLYLFRNPSTRR